MSLTESYVTGKKKVIISKKMQSKKLHYWHHE